ncbi:hypothetical protein GGR52DRAFT_226074 [Hypoxylon sp. FL1284]|nr:hypothetical protein GGR52DRAFT_226074 [Hypoxylon sp. FL1284]
MTKAEESMDDGVLEVNTGGYLAGLGVYHELHCLRQLRLDLYRDWYYPNITSKQDKWLHVHLDRCIEALRGAVMCRGNTGLYSFEWELAPKKKRPMLKSNSRSVCVKWNSFDRWDRTRMVTEEQQVKSNPFYNATL